jgi:hypothetical protein
VAAFGEGETFRERKGARLEQGANFNSLPRMRRRGKRNGAEDNIFWRRGGGEVERGYESGWLLKVQRG